MIFLIRRCNSCNELFECYIHKCDYANDTPVNSTCRCGNCIVKYDKKHYTYPYDDSICDVRYKILYRLYVILLDLKV